MNRSLSSLLAALALIAFCSLMPDLTQAQSAQSPEQLRQQFETGDRELVYTNLMKLGEPGYRIICGFFTDGKLNMHEWINWEYDYAIRMDAPNAGKSFDDYVYTTSGKEAEFLRAMSKAFARSDFPNHAFIEMMQNEQEGARMLGYVVIQTRYKDAPAFTPDGSKENRANQLSLIVKFLAAKSEK